MLPAVLALQLAPYDAVKHLLLGVGPAAPRLSAHAHLVRVGAWVRVWVRVRVRVRVRAPPPWSW